MSVDGAFYPDNEEDLKSTFNYFNELIEQHFKDRLYNEDVKALVVPHAGYMYSGFTANLAYRNVKKAPKRVVVIGPSHKVAFDGISLNDYDKYLTPLGNIAGDSNYVNELKKRFKFTSIRHEEHSTEVQFPFIKHYFKDAKVVELIYSHNASLDPIIEYVLNDEDNLLLISTDLSHFHEQQKANKLDRYIIKGIEEFDINLLSQGEACGIFGVASLIHVAKKMGLHVKGLDYRTSGDITGDNSSVVGYYSAMLY
jgi:AmmeMemoRadiSam system protein B